MNARFGSLATAIATLVLSALLVSCSTAPPARELTREFTIVGTADLQGQLDPYEAEFDNDGDGVVDAMSGGGIARIATIIRDIGRERPGGVAVVSSGDDLMNRYFHTFKGRAIFETMSLAGYELYAFGNHEFDKGPEVLAEALARADFDCVCTDLAVAGTALDGLCVPWLIKDYAGIRVGFFSLMTEGFPFVTSGGGVELSGTNVDGAAAAVADLEANGAEVIVGLTHIGIDRDAELAAAVPGIDIIFGGHSHEYTGEVVRVGGTVIVNGGEKGQYVARLDVPVDAEGTVDHDRVRFELLPVTERVPEAEDVEAVLASYRESFPDAIVLGATEIAWDMTKEAIRDGESPVANLINDRMREKFQAEIVLNNAGAFRGKKIYPPGPVTDVMLREIDEFSNYAYALDLDGRYVAEVLERSAACLGGGGLLHGAGIRYTIDPSQTAQVISQGEDGEWTVDLPGSRVTNVEVVDGTGAWMPLDPDATYRVLSNSFIVKQEGDGYFWFKRYGRNLENTYSTFYSILAEIAGNEGVLNPEDEDGRLTIVR